MIGSLTLPPNPSVLRLYKHRDEKYEKRGPYYTQPLATTSMDERKKLRFPIVHDGEEIWPEKQWQWSKSRVDQAMKCDELVIKKGKEDKWSVRYKQYLRDEDGVERGTKPFSVLDGPYTQEGTDEISDLFDDNKIFPFPKPLGLIKHLLKYLWQDTEAIVLDFFAGSGTTGQAVLELNREDGGNRKFIMVQMPEATGTTEYPTIADIAKDRIRRAIAKLDSESSEELEFNASDRVEKRGFKTFKLAKPNIQQWTTSNDRDPDTYSNKLNLHNDPLVPGWTAQNVLWELALREGFSLNTTFEEKALENGNTIHEVVDPDSGHQFVVCLDELVRADFSHAYDLTTETLLICRDIALDDSAAANLALQCRLKTI